MADKYMRKEMGYIFLERIKPQLIFRKDELTELNGIEWFRIKIFSSAMNVLYLLSLPIFILDMIIRLISGDMTSLFINIAILCWYTVLIKLKIINEVLRRILTVITIYIVGIYIVVFTARIGIGMTVILFSMITAGIILDKKHSVEILSINILVFISLTILLSLGYFDSLPIEAYKSYWVINVLVVQFTGIVSFLLMNLIFEGLKRQVDIIKDINMKVVESEEKHKAMISNICDVIVLTNNKGVIKYVSSNIHDIYGWKYEDLLGGNIIDKVYDKDKANALENYNIVGEKLGFKKTVEIRCECENGDIKDVEATAVNLLEDPNIKGILINYRDITAEKERERKVEYLNHHDILTGLYNRSYFEKAKDILDTEENLPISMIYGDVNGLKVVNDSFGHAEGDKLLIAAAQTIKNCCRENDIVARVGGDEFYILLPNATSKMAEELIEEIDKKCEQYNENNSNEAHYLSISFGTATKTKKVEHFDDILKKADDRMYRNKFSKKKELGDYALFLLKKTMFKKIPDSEKQGLRLSALSKKIGNEIGLSKEELKELELLSVMYNIGKINIDEKILKKTNDLTPYEVKEIRNQIETGYRVAKAIPELECIAYCIFTHHEAWDGTGYPKGLSGRNIPLLSRIIAVVEYYDNVMTKGFKSITSQQALEEVMKKSGTQFDPLIVDSLKKSLL